MVRPMPPTVSMLRWMSRRTTRRDGAGRDQDRLEDERDCGRDVEVRRILGKGLPRNRQRQHEGVQCEHVQEAEHAILVEKQRS